MRKIRNIVSYLLVTVMVAAFGLPILAAPAPSKVPGNAYTESMFAFPKLPKEAVVLDFKAHSDGSLDLFARLTSGSSRSAVMISYYHWRSMDKGKTWTAQNVDWAKGSDLCSIFIDDSKTIWGLVLSSDKFKTTKQHDELGEINTSYKMYNAFQLENNRIQKIPDIAFNLEKYFNHTIVGVLPTKDLVITCNYDTRLKDEESQTFVVNSETGITKKQFGIGASTGTLSGNTLYASLNRGPEVKNGRSVSIYDLSSGKKTQTTRFPGGDPDKDIPGENGSYYAMNDTGIYRLSVGAKSFTKIFDGADNAFNSDTKRIVAVCCSPDGTIYAIMQAVDGSANNNLYRYGPA